MSAKYHRLYIGRNLVPDDSPFFGASDRNMIVILSQSSHAPAKSDFGIAAWNDGVVRIALIPDVDDGMLGRVCGASRLDLRPFGSGDYGIDTDTGLMKRLPGDSFGAADLLDCYQMLRRIIYCAENRSHVPNDEFRRVYSSHGVQYDWFIDDIRSMMMKPFITYINSVLQQPGVNPAEEIGYSSSDDRARKASFQFNRKTQAFYDEATNSRADIPVCLGMLDCSYAISNDGDFFVRCDRSAPNCRKRDGVFSAIRLVDGVGIFAPTGGFLRRRAGDCRPVRREDLKVVRLTADAARLFHAAPEKSYAVLAVSEDFGRKYVMISNDRAEPVWIDETRLADG